MGNKSKCRSYIQSITKKDGTEVKVTKVRGGAFGNNLRKGKKK